MSLAVQVLAGAFIGLGCIALIMRWAGWQSHVRRHHQSVADAARWRVRAIQRTTVLELLRTAETMKTSEAKPSNLPDIVIDVDEREGS